MVATVRVDTSEMERALEEFGEKNRRRIEVAAQRAVLGTARLLMKENRKEMERVFDQPTRWTLNAFRVAMGKERVQGGQLRAEAGSTISAELMVKDAAERADDYLDTQISGGSRRQKAFELALQHRGILPAGWKAVPGQRARMDAHGNQSVGEIRQILSWFGLAELQANTKEGVVTPLANYGSTQNMTAASREKRRKGTKKKAGWEYFIVPVGGRREFARSNGKAGFHKMQPGIYRRTFYALGTRIEPVMIFVQSATYRPRFDFYGRGERVAGEAFPRLFREAFNARR